MYLSQYIFHVLFPRATENPGYWYVRADPPMDLAMESLRGSSADLPEHMLKNTVLTQESQIDK